MHFFEKIQKSIDYSKEYIKIEEIICYDIVPTDEFYGDYMTVNEWFENYFPRWERRGIYTSFSEVREQCGFLVQHKKSGVCVRNDVTMEEYFLYAEMLFNIYDNLEKKIRTNQQFRNRVEFAFSTMNAVIEKSGFELRKVNGDYIVVLKNALSIEIADKNPEVADLMVEYNHYLLKGQINKKQKLLMEISISLESKRNELRKIDKCKTDDFFFMVNNLNIRHNNVDSNGKNYHPVVKALSDEELENYYDLIYEQALILYALLSQPKRNEAIRHLKECIE